MADRYIIAAGGTGAMCARAFIYLAAANCTVTTDTYHILLVDKDKDSDAVTACENLISDYNKLREQLRGVQDSGFFYLPEIRLDRWNFTEAVVDEYVLNTGNPATDLNTLTLRKILQGRQSQELLSTIYTEKELDTDLNKGFYGHPNIGAAVFEYVRDRFLDPNPRSADGSSRVNAFMTSLRSTLQAGNAYVYLFGSLFGGTGASVIPNVVAALRSIRDNSGKQNWGQTNLVLGGALAMPYFMLPMPEADSVEARADIRPDSGKFGEQAREALKYYEESGLVSRMTNLTLVGTKQLDITSELYARGGEQHQHFHVVLQALAVSACRFFKNELPGMNALPVNPPLGDPLGNLLVWKLDPSDNGGYDTLLKKELGMENEFAEMDKFFRFSLIVASYMQSHFAQETEEVKHFPEVLSTIRNMRITAGQDAGNALPKEISDVEIEDWYKAPVALAGGFCRRFLWYYFDIAMSGYDWRGYHEKAKTLHTSETTDDGQPKDWFVYRVNTEKVASGAMDSSKLSHCWTDVVNLNKLQEVLETENPESIVHTTNLWQIMSFTPRACANGALPDRPLVQIDPASFQSSIADTYLKAMEKLEMKNNWRGRPVNSDRVFSQLYTAIYTLC